MKKRILSVGEIIWDVYPTSREIGGAPLNFAAHCAICGAESLLLSALGKDELGEAAYAMLARVGVDSRFVATVDAPTGQCTVTLDAQGVPHYCIEKDVAYDRISLSEDLRALVAEGVDACCFGTLIQRTPAARATIRELLRVGRFGEVFCDVNLRPDSYDAESARLCLESATILKLSREEEPILRQLGIYDAPTDAPKDILHALATTFGQLHTVLLTDGGNGSYAWHRDGDLILFEPAFDAGPVISTVGAGDSFGAAWLVSHLSGDGFGESLHKAAVRSGTVVAHREAIPLDHQ